MLKKIALFANWSLYKNKQNEYFAPYTNFVYIEFISSLFDKVFIISPVNNGTPPTAAQELYFDNIEVIELPHSSGFANAQKHFFIYYKTIKKIAPKVDSFYCRVPDPFSWLPALVFNQKTIMHFVGDTIDATKNNKKWSWFTKKLMIAGYLPDYFLTLLAAKKSRVYTNGHHLTNKLKRFGVKAQPVISSTIKKTDLKETFHKLSKNNIRLTYIGYLRYAKGLNTLMDVLLLLKLRNIPFHFNIVGDGEMFDEIDNFVKSHELQNNVTLYGHIENRKQINKFLDETDLFFFPSLSEGSPRVVIEAMSQGVPVISTPVGSTSFVFKVGEEIRFFDFKNAEQATLIIEEYLHNNEPFVKQREKAFQKVKNNFTIDAFLTEIFKN